jgi:two-component sensor histidine kinase
MPSDVRTKNPLAAENAELRILLAQAGLDAARLLAEAGITAIENEAAQRLQRLLLEELHHRVKNTLATIMAITSQSLRDADSLATGSAAVEHRLFALGRAHDLLLRSQIAGASLIDIIHAAIEPFDSGVTSRFSVHGDPIAVGAEAVLSLSMSLNELCTNAVKHGALSNETGRIEIASAVAGSPPRLTLTWIESGGPVVTEPSRRSFGTRLIRRLAEELHGAVELRYEPGGLVYRLDIPQAALKGAAVGTGLA